MAARPIPFPTPSGRVPRWLIWAFPDLAGVEDNPLFIRLSNQGFRKPKRWFGSSVAPELRPHQTWAAGRLGRAPIIAAGAHGSFVLVSLLASGLSGAIHNTYYVVIPIFIYLSMPAAMITFVVAVFVTLARLFGLGRTVGVDAFLENAAKEPWAVDLYMSPLKPKDYNRAVFASLMMEKRWFVFSWWILFSAFGLLMWIFFGNELPGIADMVTVGAFAVLLASECVMLSTLNLLISLESALALKRRGMLRQLGESVEYLVIIAIVHFLGLFLVGIYLAVGMPFTLLQDAFNSETHPIALALVLLAAFVLPSLVTGFFFGRTILANAGGSVGTAFHEQVRSDGRSA